MYSLAASHHIYSKGCITYTALLYELAFTETYSVPGHCCEVKQWRARLSSWKGDPRIGAGATSYRNDPKFSDRQVWANSADPDQTAPRGAV